MGKELIDEILDVLLIADVNARRGQAGLQEITLDALKEFEGDLGMAKLRKPMKSAYEALCNHFEVIIKRNI